MKLYGTYTAMVTPFRDGRVDDAAWGRLLDMQSAGGVAGVVPCGCTGEAATMSVKERLDLLTVTLERVGDLMQVIPGTGTNATESTIELTREAERAGAHAAMLITPYYNKPSQQGLLDHYRRIGDATELPLILYNVPGRTGVTLAPETIARIYETGRYVALKEAGGSIDAVSNVRAACEITILSGDDSMTVSMMALGAQGVISVVSNLYPNLVSEMTARALEGDFERAAQLHFRLLPVMRAAFVESNPSPIKAMLAMNDTIVNELRPPLAPVSPASLDILRASMEAARSVSS